MRFNSRPSHEGRLLEVYMTEADFMFQFTPLARGATEMLKTDVPKDKFQFTPLAPDGAEVVDVSIHAPRTRGDVCCLVVLPVRKFQFTPLARGATQLLNSYAVNNAFQFTPLARGATRAAESRRRP